MEQWGQGRLGSFHYNQGMYVTAQREVWSKLSPTRVRVAKSLSYFSSGQFLPKSANLLLTAQEYFNITMHGFCIQLDDTIPPTCDTSSISLLFSSIWQVLGHFLFYPMINSFLNYKRILKAKNVITFLHSEQKIKK